MPLPHPLEAAIHSVDSGLLLTSATGEPQVHNRHVHLIWGVDESVFASPDWTRVLRDRLQHPQTDTPFALDDLPGTEATVRQLLRTHDGRWIEQVRVAIREDGVPTAWAWKWLDVTAQKDLEISLQSSHDLLRKLSLRVPGIIFKFRMWPDGRSCFPYMSDAVSTMYPGVTPEAIRDDATPFFAFRHPDDAVALQASMLQSAKTMEPWDHEYRLLIPERGIVWRHGTARPERQDDGSIAWHGFITDITDRKKLEQELLLTSSVFETSSEGILVVDGDNRIVTVNPSFTRITGFTLEEVLGKDSSLITYGRHGPVFDPVTQAELDSDGNWEGELWSRRKNGDLYPQWLRIRTVAGKRNLPTHRLVIFSDISEQKKADEHIWRQANFDALTNLPNRRLMLDRLRQEIHRSARNDVRVALLFVDLDNFKEVNDTLGHDAGDQLLGEAARRISHCVREADTVARMGGDEFTVILVGPDVAHVAERTAQAIAQQMAQPFMIEHERAFVSASIGITVYPDDADNMDTLLKNADQAMYAAKRGGRNQLSWFKSSMQVAAARRRKLADHLRDALPRNQFLISDEVQPRIGC